MAKEKFTPIPMGEFQVGNINGMYLGRFTQNGHFEYDLEIFEQVEKEVKVETTSIRQVKVEVEKIRPVFGKLSDQEIDKRAKQIAKYLKENKIDDAVKMIAKTKKMRIETDLKFDCEIYIEEETIVHEVPLIKTDMEVSYKLIKTYNYLTRLRPKEVRQTLTTYINNVL